MNISLEDVSSHLQLAADVVHTLLRWQAGSPEPITIHNPNIITASPTAAAANNSSYPCADNALGAERYASSSAFEGSPGVGEPDGSAMVQSALLALLAHITTASRRAAQCSRQADEGSALISALADTIGELRALAADQKKEIDALRASVASATTTTTTPPSRPGTDSSPPGGASSGPGSSCTSTATAAPTRSGRAAACRDAAVCTEGVSWAQLEETMHVSIYLYIYENIAYVYI